MLAHGGAQIQIERTMEALTQVGVQAEPLQWWNDKQNCDVLHQIGEVPAGHTEMAHNKKWKVVSTMLLTETCNRSATQLLLRRILIRGALGSPLPGVIKQRLPWRSFHDCDKVIVGLRAERRVIESVYGVPSHQVAVVPLGLTETFLRAGPPERTDKHLICTGRITADKNSVELALLAREAQVPVLFVGKPFNPLGDYWKRFQGLIDHQFVEHHAHVSDEREMAALLRRARGYVLMSRYENWSLAAHEAAACGLPLMLPDQPWSRERFDGQATYWPKKGRQAAIAALRQFYELCPSLPAPKVELLSWRQVAEILKKVYEDIAGH